MENIEELSKGKIIFLLNRNTDSFNMFHGICEFMKAMTLMYILKLKPEDIKIIFWKIVKIKLIFFMIYIKFYLEGEQVQKQL